MKKGISLVALVITIIVLIIITAAVILTLTRTSMLDQATGAVNIHNEQEVHNAVQREVLKVQAEKTDLPVGEEFAIKLQERLDKKYPEAQADVKYNTKYNNINIVYTLSNKKYKLILDTKYLLTLTEYFETIEADQEYVGYYADIDGDKKPDGIIYADLLFEKNGDWFNKQGILTNADGTFTYAAITDDPTQMKEYYVSKTNYNGPFGTKDVLTPTGHGLDRFYVMALEDINVGTQYCWYDKAYTDQINDYSTVTLKSFGTGNTNTDNMIAKWKDSVYGEKNNNSTYDDIWGVTQKQGWFVPSREEWAAFGYNLGITKSNYINYGLSQTYWSSSLATVNTAFYANFTNGNINRGNINSNCSLRLSTTY